MIVLNENALEQRIQNAVDKAVEKIKANANNGIAITDITFEKDIFLKCKAKLNEFCKENQINFGWLDLGGGYVSLDYGTHRLAKFKLKQ
jgi:hypothetical protein